MSKSKRRITVHRSSVTGRFITENQAKRNPNRTEKEKIRRK